MPTLKASVAASVPFLQSAATRLCSTTNRLVRENSRASLLAAGAATAGLLGGACTIAAAAPWDQAAAGSVSSTVHGGSLASSGDSGTSALDVFGGAVHASQSARGSNPSRVAPPRVAPPRVAPSKAAPVKAVATAKAAPAKAVAPAKAALAKSAPVKAATTARAAKPAQRQAHRQAHRPAANPGPSKPYLVYDSVTPNTLPPGRPAAVYANGAYAVAGSQVARHDSVLWIDINGSDPSANVLDVEPGDATPRGAARWVHAHLTKQPHSVAIVYTMLSDWHGVKEAVGGLPSWMQSHVRYWIADPTGVNHVVRGASATQWYWGDSYDISTANPNFEQ
jgi:hypothetical protein